jgi:hypothetical protein
MPRVGMIVLGKTCASTFAQNSKSYHSLYWHHHLVNGHSVDIPNKFLERGRI